MKKALLVLLATATLMVMVTPASASLVPPFTPSLGVAPTSVSKFPAGTLVVSTGKVKYTFGTPTNPNKNSGTVEEDVYRDKGGFLFFVFQLVVAGSKNSDIVRLSTGDWDNSISINAEQYTPAGDKKAFGVDRNGLGTVAINWNPLLLKGQTSSFVILYTDATRYEAGTLGLIDSGSSPSIPGYVASAPEPATLALLGCGLLGMGMFRKRWNS